MMTLVATVLFIVLATSNASKYVHPFHHYHQEKESYPSDSSESNEGESAGMLAKLAARLRSAGDEDAWEPVPDPRMYVLTELESPGGSRNPFQDLYREDLRPKRKGPSLSIVNPLEVLQEKWLLELNRRQKAGMIQRNRELLSHIGKRSTGRSGAELPSDFSQRFLPFTYQT